MKNPRPAVRRSHPTASQQLYVSPEGHLLDACGSPLFAPEMLRRLPLTALFPILECCWPRILAAPNDDSSGFSLPCVHLELAERKGIFDLHFLKIRLDQKEAVWFFLADRSRTYLRRHARQQARNERRLLAGA